MTTIFRILMTFIVLASFHLLGEETFGYISYYSTNIGDDLQTVAARRFLPKNSIPINREFLADFKHQEKVKTVVNGWFLHAKHNWWWPDMKPPKTSWPPSPSIDPLLISLHFIPSFFTNVLNEEGIEYLKAHGPVGARDYATLEALENRGIPTYFSGCLTLTLQDNKSTKKQNVIYAVDLTPDHLALLRKKTKTRVVPISHAVPQDITYDNAKRLKYAEELLKKYSRAKCVVTSRLHAAMPCLALDTPVLFISDPNSERFHGLRELTHHCSNEQFLRGDYHFNFDHPSKNPDTYLSIRKNLIETLENWVSENR